MPHFPAIKTFYLPRGRVKQAVSGMRPAAGACTGKESGLFGALSFPFEYAHLKEGETVLDVGCGTGADTLKAGKAVGARGLVIGLDRSEEMLKLARRNGKNAGSKNTRFVHARIEAAPLAEGAVDAVISNLVFHIIEDKPKAFAEALRVLKPGGRLVITDLILFGEHVQTAAPPSEVFHHILPMRRYCGILKAAGFKRIKIVPLQNRAFSSILKGTLRMALIAAVK